MPTIVPTPWHAIRPLKWWLRSTRRTRWYAALARQFVDVLIGILPIAAAIAFAIGEVGDAVTILAIVLLNGILGFVQEWKAEQALPDESLPPLTDPQSPFISTGTSSLELFPKGASPSRSSGTVAL